jgi:hypothetical protein
MLLQRRACTLAVSLDNPYAVDAIRVFSNVFPTYTYLTATTLRWKMRAVWRCVIQERTPARREAIERGHLGLHSFRRSGTTSLCNQTHDIERIESVGGWPHVEVDQQRLAAQSTLIATAGSVQLPARVQLQYRAERLRRLVNGRPAAATRGRGRWGRIYMLASLAARGIAPDPEEAAASHP